MHLREERARISTPRGVRPLAPRWVFHGCFVSYVIILAWVTLTPRPSSIHVPAEWIPFENIIHVLRGSESVSYANAGQLLGNIALFVPFGWLLPMLWWKLRSLWGVVAVAAPTSLAIELSQLLFISGRQSSVDDVILNVTGAFIGAVMFFAPMLETRDQPGREDHSPWKP